MGLAHPQGGSTYHADGERPYGECQAEGDEEERDGGHPQAGEEDLVRVGVGVGVRARVRVGVGVRVGDRVRVRVRVVPARVRWRA